MTVNNPFDQFVDDVPVELAWFDPETDMSLPTDESEAQATAFVDDGQLIMFDVAEASGDRLQLTITVTDELLEVLVKDNLERRARSEAR